MNLILAFGVMLVSWVLALCLIKDNHGKSNFFTSNVFAIGCFLITLGLT